MVTETKTRESKAPSLAGIIPYRLTVDQFLKVSNAGAFGESERVELLGGELSVKTTKLPSHTFAIEQLAELLRKLVSPDYIVREE
jgi:hypothetical protein